MSKTKENINIFLNTTEKKEAILSTASSQESYIILMNDYLHSENKDYRDKNSELEYKIEELETDNTRMEGGRTYMKGILKNFNEITKSCKEVNKYKQIIMDNTQKEFKIFQVGATKHLRVLESGLFIFLGIWYEYHSRIDFLLILSVILVIAAFQESTLLNLKLPQFKKEKDQIVRLEKEIKDVEAAQDYIYDLIDHL